MSAKSFCDGCLLPQYTVSFVLEPYTAITTTTTTTTTVNGGGDWN